MSRPHATIPGGAHAPAREGFAVPRWLDALGGFVASHRRLWIRLGHLETTLLGGALDDVSIDRPVYVAGLARSGTTMLLELLARHRDVATHRYRDHPFVFTPYAWNRFLDHGSRARARPVERSHGDGVRITPESPEAFEEVLWMAFFPDLHDPGTSDVLDARMFHPAFERFYRDHVRKLLLARRARRYGSKANYNLTRLEYLIALFPDARFVVPVREPVSHVASMMRQHARFSAGERNHPRALRYLRHVGHFEFGLERRPINAGDRDAVARVEALWDAGDEVRGWARYWSSVYGYVASALARNGALRDATLIVRYEDMCRAPRRWTRTLLDHCRLEASTELIEHAERTCRRSLGHASGLAPSERAAIAACTRETAARFGYRRDGTHSP